MREKVKFANSSLCKARAGQESLRCTSISSSSLEVPYPTCFALIQEENPPHSPKRFWRNHVQQSRWPSQPRHFAKSHPLCISLSIITDQPERHHPWEVSGKGNGIARIPELQILCPNTSQRLLRAEPPSHRSARRRRASAGAHREPLRGFRHHISNPHLLFYPMHISNRLKTPKWSGFQGKPDKKANSPLLPVRKLLGKCPRTHRVFHHMWL